MHTAVRCHILLPPSEQQRPQDMGLVTRSPWPWHCQPCLDLSTEPCPGCRYFQKFCYPSPDLISAASPTKPGLSCRWMSPSMPSFSVLPGWIRTILPARVPKNPRAVTPVHTEHLSTPHAATGLAASGQAIPAASVQQG